MVGNAYPTYTKKIEAPIGCAITGVGCWGLGVLLWLGFWGLVIAALYKYVFS